MVSLLLIGVSVGLFIPLRLAWKDWKRLYGVYWILAAMFAVGLYFFAVSTVGLVRYLCCFTSRHRPNEKKKTTKKKKEKEPAKN